MVCLGVLSEGLLAGSRRACCFPGMSGSEDHEYEKIENTPDRQSAR